MGPATGGRIAAVAGVPGDSMTIYWGAASGGVWKSIDGGQSHAPVFDNQKVQAIGSLAVSPSNPEIVWAGTGEAWAIRDADVMGDGIYKSVDAGVTWTNMGLGETGRIGRIIIHPINPDIVYACALGRATGPQPDRGVFRTRDGGKNWERVLFVDPKTGCSGLTMDAKDPNVLFAGMWEVVMHTWAMFSGGPGSSIHVTRDGGSTWSRLNDPGLPKPPLGKIDVAIAPSDPQRVYALIQTANQGSLWRSDDGGATWRVA
ncbi:MAG TPA: glycosyl hydrolase, partial [Gemmatimonadales bacterium]|nr:glycosyl hydrolase [Gemmatimonadales bacterium]